MGISASFNMPEHVIPTVGPALEIATLSHTDWEGMSKDSPDRILREYSKDSIDCAEAATPLATLSLDSVINE
jgi:hypothetical protein